MKFTRRSLFTSIAGAAAFVATGCKVKAAPKPYVKPMVEPWVRFAPNPNIKRVAIPSETWKALHHLQVKAIEKLAQRNATLDDIPFKGDDNE